MVSTEVHLPFLQVVLETSPYKKGPPKNMAGGTKTLQLFIPNAQCMDYHTYIWVVFVGVNVGKYIIPRVFGYGI